MDRRFQYGGYVYPMQTSSPNLHSAPPTFMSANDVGDQPDPWNVYANDIPGYENTNAIGRVDSVRVIPPPALIPYPPPPLCLPPYHQSYQFVAEHFTDGPALAGSLRATCTIPRLAETLINWMAQGTSNSKNLTSITFWKADQSHPRQTLLSFSIGNEIDTIQVVRVDIPKPYPTPLSEPWMFIYITGCEVFSNVSNRRTCPNAV
jgi:hypothetical protein